MYFTASYLYPNQRRSDFEDHYFNPSYEKFANNLVTNDVIYLLKNMNPEAKIITITNYQKAYLHKITTETRTIYNLVEDKRQKDEIIALSFCLNADGAMSVKELIKQLLKYKDYYIVDDDNYEWLFNIIINDDEVIFEFQDIIL